LFFRALQRLAIIVFMSSVKPRKLGTKVDRLVRKTMSVDSPKAQISGGKAAKISQRVEDNAFHLVRRALTNVKFPPAKPHTSLPSWKAFI
jgi:hypothetical protein